MKKIIAITANTSWYLYNFRKNTILSLLSNGYEIIAISPLDKYSNNLKILGCKVINVDIDQGGTNPIKDFITIYQFIKIYKRNKIDIVLNFTPKNNIYSSYAAKLFKIKTINNIAGLGTLFINKSITTILVKYLYKTSQKRVDKIFFQNEDDKNLFLKNNLITSSKVDRLPGSGADLSRFVYSPAPDDGVIRFLLISRMLKEKGIIQFIEAARHLKKTYGSNVEFNLLGFLAVNNPSAITKTEMKLWVDEGIVNYLGVSDLVEIEIAAADCIVLPSFYREGVPKSLIEAGAMGKPIITTDNIGCRETVSDGINGFLCTPRSTESLISAMEKMINLSHSERLQMGLNSRKKMETEFDERIVITKYLSAIQDLCENKTDYIQI